MKKDLKSASKYLSYLLRHEPQSVGLKLDQHGWATLVELMELTDLSRELIEEVVFTNDKQRFSFSPDGLKIRANQGHSIDAVNLDLEPQEPPAELYHGTVFKFLEEIKLHGLQKVARNHVHLSATIDTAKNVGARRGKPIILAVNSAAMHKDGFQFYLSHNGVWLTDRVPAEYLRQELL